MKKGFTIVELLMVIAILAILLTIVTSAATSSIRQSRDRQAQAMKRVLHGGITTYHSRNNSQWPGKLEDWAKRPQQGTLGYLSNGDYDNVMHELLKASSGKSTKSRVMDPVGLTVIPTSGMDGRLNCEDYRAVTTKNNKYAKRMEPNEMTVVYPRRDNGKAYRFVIEYNTQADGGDVTVMTQEEFNSKTGRNWNGGEVWN